VRTTIRTKKTNNLKIKLAGALVCVIVFTNAQQVNTLAGNTTQGSNDGISSSASFNNPFGVTTDGQGNLYVADAGNNEIREISIETGAVTTIAGSTGAGIINGSNTTARFNYPTGVACDGQGNLYVADCYNNQIRKIVLATGAVTTIAGSITNGTNDGTGTAASFYNPCGIVSDGQGNLYIADGLNSTIRKIVIATGKVTTIAGSTNMGSSDGKGTAASFNYPSALVLDGQGNLFVVDEGNNEIRQIALTSGMVSTLAGSTSWGFANGEGASAKFNAPYGITTDGKGNLFVADGNNNQIRSIVIATGMVNTLAGAKTQGADNGDGVSASFNNPKGIASDANGNLYVADFGNNEIRVVGNLFTGIDNVAEIAQASVFPNPAHQNIGLNFNGQENSTHVFIRIIDMAGNEVSNTTTEIVNNRTTAIDISALSSGTYLAQIITNEGTEQVAKFIKD